MSARRSGPTATRSTNLSRTRQVSNRNPPEYGEITQSVLSTFTIENLHRGFAEVQKKFSHLLNGIDRNENVGILLEPLGSLTIGIQSLRDIAAAIIEKDPHYACMNKVFEDLWLLGFTRPLKLCNKFESSGKYPESARSFPAWRTGLMLDWQGYLCCLRDMLKLYCNPQPAFRLVPTLKHSLPVQYSSRDGQTNPLNHLPLNYLLRDIALCLARTYSHENLELEKVWMKRALEINGLLGGLSYKDAWEALSTKSEKEKARVASGVPTPRKILGRVDEIPLMANMEEVVKVLVTEKKVEEQEEVVSEASSERSSEVSKNSTEYGAVVASQRDLEVMRLFKGRNAFIQGLLEAAENQSQSGVNGAGSAFQTASSASSDNG